MSDPGTSTDTSEAAPPADTTALEWERGGFIPEIIDADIASGRWGPAGDPSVIRTRFPPEPNGYLHIGHAKAVVVSFGLARKYTGAGNGCVLRFDDTNPVKEEQEFVESIVHDIRWLGFRWPEAPPSPHTPPGDKTYGARFASDYFERMYEWARELITKGLAYVDEQTPDEIRAQRGTLKAPGTPSPFRDRPAEESLDTFERMKNGEFEDGAMVLRAKIDMGSPNINLRDPIMYRILNAEHHRTGDAWHIYPMYDWAHGLEDSIEGITHSICTLEFEDHRPLYDWFIDAINRDRGPGSEWGDPIHHPQQIEFARLNPASIVTSKRKLRQLVEEGTVEGWDDPRMPTLSGLRRRGVTPEAVRAFCQETGLTKTNAVHDLALLENAVREHLNRVAPRRMAVLDPLKLTITNWGEHNEADAVEMMSAVNNPEDEHAGTRQVPFSGALFIERDDFMLDAPKKFFRLKPGGEVRLRYGYWVTCHDHATDGDGNVTELFCTYDPLTRGGNAPPPDAEGKQRKVKGTIHWVSAAHARPAVVRLIDRLFVADRPGKKTGDPIDDLNPDAMVVRERAMLEPALAGPAAADEPAWGDGIRRFQFERLGYFCADASSTADAPVFNRTMTLKDSWAKAQKKG